MTSNNPDLINHYFKNYWLLYLKTESEILMKM